MFKESFTLIRTAATHSLGLKPVLVKVVILELVSVALLYFLNMQYGLIYQGIQDYNIPLIWKGVAFFSGLAGVLVFVGGLITYFTNQLAFLIREGLLTALFFEPGTVSVPDNLGQRIQEDLKVFGEKSCEFWFAVFRSVLKLPIFVGVIITLTHWWVGIVVVAAVVLGTYVTKLMANPLVKLQSIQESNEGNLRKTITDGDILYSRLVFDSITDMFSKINTQTKRLSFLQSGLGQGFVLLPFILLLPLYISKAVTMGAFMQAVNALGKVIESLTVIIDQRQLMVGIATSVARIKQIHKEEK